MSIFVQYIDHPKADFVITPTYVLQEAFKTPVIASPASGTTAPPSTPEASPSPLLQLNNSAKEELIQQIALKTGMNVEWSIK